MIDVTLDLRYLGCAIIADELGSFRRTADHLGLAQSVVSRRISILERKLGFLLFERSRSGVRSTAAGQRFLEHALLGVNQLSVATREAISILKGTSGEVRVGIASATIGGAVWETLSEFRKRFPGVRVILKECSTEQALQSVAAGKIDIAITLGADVSLDCVSKFLWTETVMAALPADHHLLHQPGVTWDDLRDETFIIPGSGIGPDVARCISERFYNAEHMPQISVQEVSQASIMEMVSLGYGVTLVCCSWIRNDINKVAFRPLAIGAKTVATSAVWHEGNSNPNVKKLVTIATAIGEAVSQENRSV